MKIIKTMLWILAPAVVSLSLVGCFSLGAWAGHDEKIIPWEPRLAVEEPVSPVASVEAVSPAPKAVVAPPDILTAPARKADPVMAAETARQAAAEEPLPAVVSAAVAPSAEKIAAAEPAAVVAAATVPAEGAPTAAPAPAVSAEKMIDDAAKLDSNSTRRSVYVAVAKRFDLGANAQVRLVNDTYDNLVSETAMEEVFITLIQNPNFAPAAQHAILKRADEFLSESARQRVTAALTPK